MVSEAIRSHDFARAEDVLTPATAMHLSVYANHHLITLREALERGYPVTRRLLGPGNFRYFARRYCSSHPPTAPSVDHFGDRFAEHLAAEPEVVRTQPELPYFAKLDWAHHHPLAPAVVELSLPAGLLRAYEECRATGAPGCLQFGGPERIRLERSDRRPETP